MVVFFMSLIFCFRAILALALQQYIYCMGLYSSMGYIVFRLTVFIIFLSEYGALLEHRAIYTFMVAKLISCNRKDIYKQILPKTQGH